MGVEHCSMLLFLTLLFSKKEQNQWCQMSEIYWAVLMVSVTYGQDGSRGVGRGVCILPPAIFKIAFDVYNFSIILSLFDSDKP